MRNPEGKNSVWEKLKAARLKEWLTILGVSLALCVACFFIFNKQEDKKVAYEPTFAGTEMEQRLATLLSEIEGVGSVQVMIGNAEDGAKSVVVVCSGAKNLQVIMDVREAAASAVGTSQKNVKVYHKEN